VRFIATLPAFLWLILAIPVQADTSNKNNISLELETGALNFSRNDARIPGDTGTKFDILDLTGKGSSVFFRLNADWQLNSKHGLRLVLAPLAVDGTGNLSQQTRFADTTFDAGPTKARYQFNTVKITYHYTFASGEDWRWRVGFTGLIRDADIELQQGNKKDNDDNLGFAPLLHLYGEYTINPKSRFSIDFDGLASPQGRAIDLAFKYRYDIDKHWHIGGGYRTVEGGVDNDTVYNFAWLHYAVFTLGYQF